MLDFHKFKIAVAKQFKEMSEKGLLFETTADRDTLINTYLDSFPEGTNKVYITNREYDCGTCKNFIRIVGGIVSVDENLNVHTIWDVEASDIDPAFKTVAAALASEVRKHGILNKFLHFESVAGVNENHQMLADGRVK